MKKITFVYAFVFLFVIQNSSFAQDVLASKQSFGLGLTSGYGKPTQHFANAFILGVQANYTYDFSTWFGLRASANWFFSLPTETQSEMGGFIDDVVQRSASGTFALSPVVFKKIGRSKILAGANLNLAFLFNSENIKSSNLSTTESVFWTAGSVVPFVGYAIELKNEGKYKNELEFLVVPLYFNQVAPNAMFSDPLKYRAITLQINYRILF